MTAIQQQVPAGALSRVSAFDTVTAFALGPIAFAVAGPVAEAVGAGSVLGFGAAWSAVSSAAVLALPAIWARAGGSPRHRPPALLHDHGTFAAHTTKNVP